MKKELLARNLPDLMTMNDGTPVTAENWPQRRQELLNALQEHLYGYTEAAQLEQIAAQRQAWLDMERYVSESRLNEKFINLLVAAVTPNKVDAEMAHATQAQSVDVVYTMQPFTTIADSMVEVLNCIALPYK